MVEKEKLEVFLIIRKETLPFVMHQCSQFELLHAFLVHVLVQFSTFPAQGYSFPEYKRRQKKLSCKTNPTGIWKYVLFHQVKRKENSITCLFGVGSLVPCGTYLA
jgi:hypothetical protein